VQSPRAEDKLDEENLMAPPDAGHVSSDELCIPASNRHAVDILANELSTIGTIPLEGIHAPDLCSSEGNMQTLHNSDTPAAPF
jgi:hypothetical protein